MLSHPDAWRTGATFSPCRGYRYRLWREWGDPSHRCAFVGLNPSTADENADDPTMRRCIDFCRRWGFGAFDMVNLFAWRSTDPMGLTHQQGRAEHGLDPVGPDNDAHLVLVASRATRVVMAWGQHEFLGDLLTLRAHAVETLLRSSVSLPRELGTLGRNKNGKGQPKHPLYLPKFTSFVDHQVEQH